MSRTSASEGSEPQAMTLTSSTKPAQTVAK